MQSDNGGMTIKWLLLFSALPGGYRNNNGNFNNQGNNGNCWRATENDASNAYNRHLNCNNANLNRNNNNKGCGFSVRLLRDLTGNGKPRGFVLRGTFYKGYQTMYADERQRIVTELFQAYFDARRNKRNTINARRYLKFAVDEGAMPCAPHLLDPQVLDDSDPAQRRLGLLCGMVWLCKCDEL